VGSISVSYTGRGFIFFILMSEEIRDLKETVSYLAETQRILSDSFLLQQQQLNEFQQVLSTSLRESERRFDASLVRLEAILLNQQHQIQLSEERIRQMDERFAEEKAESAQRFNILLQEIRYVNKKIEESQ
jgi:hypothetical protein